MKRREELTDGQWSLIEPLFDKTDITRTRGRHRRAEREVMNGVLWILRSGARWYDLPKDFRPTKPAIAVSMSGSKTKECEKSWKL